jgi:hypothetical protein
MAVQGFRVDKPPEVPCTHLNAQQRCRIHSARSAWGYAACAGFDCFGAGQWITQRLFKGASWKDSPDTARRMFDAYRYFVPRFEAAAMLEAALAHVRTDAQRAFVDRIEALTRPVPTDAPPVTDAAKLRKETIAMIRAAL